MNTQSKTVQTPSLREGQLLFEGWRNTKTHPRQPIPENLWNVAAELTKKHSPTKVAKHLRLNVSALRDAVSKQLLPTKQDIVVTGKDWNITCRRSDGATLNLTGVGDFPNINNTIVAFLI